MGLHDYLEQHKTYTAREKESVSVGGETVDLDDSQTVQQINDSILGANVHGVPRGKEAYQARKLGESWPMELIKNAINDQLSGGELGIETPEDDDPDEAATTLWSLYRDILEGPHYQGDDFDDLVAAAVSDMCDIGTGYWEPVPSADGSLPVAALKPVDALTVRHNVKPTGEFDDPPYYQAPFRSHGGSIVSGVENSDLQKLDHDDLVVMRYPGSKRSNRVYPRAPGMQVQSALEHLTHSTTHAQRFYNDNELPSGFVQIMDAGEQTIEDVKETIKNAAGDPRTAGVVGGEGPANWIEMGGTSLSLDILEEQKWFIQLCLAAFGLNKQEIGLVDDVNRSEGDNQLSIVHKRVTKGFLKTLSGAITRQVFGQFDTYQELPDDQRFSLRISHSDPRQEHAREERLRARYNDGALTYNEYRQMLGEEPDDSTVEIGGTTIDYGEYPKHIVDALVREAQSDGAGSEGAGANGDGNADGNESANENANGDE